MSTESVYIKGQDWDKQVTLIYEFHLKMQEEHGATSGKQGRPKRFEIAWTIKDTADALELSIGNISESINLAKHLILYPELKYAKDRVTALKIIQGKDQGIQLPNYLEFSNTEFLNHIANLLIKNKEDKDIINRLKKLAKEIK